MNINPEQFIIGKAAEAVKSLYGAEVQPSALQVQVTRKEFEGDYTLVVFPLLKISKGSPEATGNAIGEYLRENCEEISAFNVVKGFLNISFSTAYWNGLFAGIAAEDDFGQLEPTGRTVMVEFSSPNTNKPLHLGHIRNNLLGWSVSRLLEANGNRVLKVNLVNDRGIHICKSMLAWLKTGNGETPESSGKKGDHLVGDYYVAFNNIYQEEVDALAEELQSVIDALQPVSEENVTTPDDGMALDPTNTAAANMSGMMIALMAAAGAAAAMAYRRKRS